MRKKCSLFLPDNAPIVWCARFLGRTIHCLVSCMHNFLSISSVFVSHSITFKVTTFVSFCSYLPKFNEVPVLGLLTC